MASLLNKVHFSVSDLILLRSFLLYSNIDSPQQRKPRDYGLKVRMCVKFLKMELTPDCMSSLGSSHATGT
jgi:hypothetical protein